MRSSLGFVYMLLAIWLLAWGSLSWANVVSGLVVALGRWWPPGARRRTHLPVVAAALARLAAPAAQDLVVSDVVLTASCAGAWSRIATGVWCGCRCPRARTRS